MPKRKRFKDATASPIKRYKLVFGEGVVYDNSSVEEYLKALDINLKKMTEVMTKAQKFHSFLGGILRDSTSSLKSRLEAFQMR